MYKYYIAGQADKTETAGPMPSKASTNPQRHQYKSASD